MPWPTARTALSLALAITGLKALAMAQTVQGILVNEKSHLPIGNARVQLIDSLGHVVAEAVSDTGLAGAFYLTAETPGTYALRAVVGHGGVSYSSRFSLDSNQVLEKTFGVPDWPKEFLEAYLASEVSKPATIPPRGRVPRYPDLLRAEGREGVTRVRFVVDREGHAVMSTFEVLETGDPAFSDAVRSCVDQLRFSSAQRDGVAVAQVFDLAVDFGFGATPPRLEKRDGFGIIVRALGEVRKSP